MAYNLPLREVHQLKVFKKEIQRRILEPKRDENGTGEFFNIRNFQVHTIAKTISSATVISYTRYSHAQESRSSVHKP